MFRENVEHLQKDMFGLFYSMPESMQQKAEDSEESAFYNWIFCNIDEQNFSSLYADSASRPNAPVNSMVSALIWMHRNNWTYDKLFRDMQFNLLTRLSFGLDDVETMPFCPATLFNFQNRLTSHYMETGQDLIEEIFDNLTSDQIKELGLKTNIQRTDSFLANSNIRDYTRVQILVETVIRFYRVLSDSDKQEFYEYFKDYLQGSSGQYIYKLQKSELPHEIEKLAKLYQWIVKRFKKNYRDVEIYKRLKRVYHEHFTVKNKKVYVKPVEQLSSDSLQSPDDPEATFRTKRGKNYKGRSINIVESIHPDNEINVITDVAVTQNNKDDSAILNERCQALISKTPDLEEIHYDGAYGSTQNDKKLQQHNITSVQTAVRGRKSLVRFEFEALDENRYLVKCPCQQTESTWTRTRFKACFDRRICSTCPHQDDCPAQKRKTNRTFYFDHDDVLKWHRANMIHHIPKERRTLRNNVEATVNEFKCKMRDGKLKVRNTFKTRIFAFTTAISVNFGRIYRYKMA